jgi:dephospho-CoA kinase
MKIIFSYIGIIFYTRIMIIGILGRSRSGKDSIATIIQKIYPHYTIQRFAQPIKNALKEIYNFTPEQLEDDSKEVIDIRHNITPREAMQEMTRYYLNKHGPDFFSKQVFRLYDNNIEKCIIVPDVRYAYDIHQIKRRGGLIIKVIRPMNTHTIEHSVEDHINSLQSDYTIQNDSDLLSLEKKVAEIFNQNE